MATSFWLAAVAVGVLTAVIMFVSDSFPDEVREEKQEPNQSDDAPKK